MLKIGSLSISKKQRYFSDLQDGNNVHWWSAWGHIAMADINRPIGKMDKRNSKTDVVWAKNIGNARDDLLDYPQEKYEENVCY